jgi:hypothetical protein
MEAGVGCHSPARFRIICNFADNAIPSVKARHTAKLDNRTGRSKELKSRRASAIEVECGLQTERLYFLLALNKLQSLANRRQKLSRSCAGSACELFREVNDICRRTFG